MPISEKELSAFQQERLRMVEGQIIRRGVKDPQVLCAMREIPRHLFVAEGWRPEAYGDHPLPIGCDQTISQPYIVAVMTENLQLRPGATVLEIGTGSGYQAAILARIARLVVSVERHVQLAGQAATLLTELGYGNVRVLVGDGSLGCLEEAPYDGIVVTAGTPQVPTALLAQLAEGGRLVAPVGNSQVQSLITVVRHGDRYSEEQGFSCRFVPLVGAQGWKSEQAE